MTLKLARAQKTAKSNNPPRRKRNADQRTREYLTVDEVARLRQAARSTGRNGVRDDLLIGMLFRHGLRVAEASNLTRDALHLERGTVLITRAKRGVTGTHYLTGDELRQLRRVIRESSESRYVFCSERGGPMSTRTIRHIVARAGEIAGFAFSVHPHMLRHSKGYQLANKGVDTRAIQGYLGHADIRSTVVYTALAANRFKGLEADD